MNTFIRLTDNEDGDTILINYTQIAYVYHAGDRTVIGTAAGTSLHVKETINQIHDYIQSKSHETNRH
jgi:DNA-binding LytR/AlgR family response regulator